MASVLFGSVLHPLASAHRHFAAAKLYAPHRCSKRVPACFHCSLFLLFPPPAAEVANVRSKAEVLEYLRRRERSGEGYASLGELQDAYPGAAADLEVLLLYRCVVGLPRRDLCCCSAAQASSARTPAVSARCLAVQMPLGRLSRSRPANFCMCTFCP